MVFKELLNKENENRLVIIIGLIIIILIIIGFGINKMIIEREINKRIDYSKVNACQKGCNDMARMLSTELQKEIDVFPCLEFCNRHYYEVEEIKNE